MTESLRGRMTFLIPTPRRPPCIVYVRVPTRNRPPRILNKTPQFQLFGVSGEWYDVH